MLFFFLWTWIQFYLSKSYFLVFDNYLHMKSWKSLTRNMILLYVMHTMTSHSMWWMFTSNTTTILPKNLLHKSVYWMMHRYILFTCDYYACGFLAQGIEGPFIILPITLNPTISLENILHIVEMHTYFTTLYNIFKSPSNATNKAKWLWRLFFENLFTKLIFKFLFNQIFYYLIFINHYYWVIW